MSARFKLSRPDGGVYLERWGWECKWFGVFVHHMAGPDPGKDLHDHPWNFASLILKGGYNEWRAQTRTPGNKRRSVRKRWSWKALRRNECHRIDRLHGNTWTLVLHGPRLGEWGFYVPEGWMEWHQYDNDGRRGLATSKGVVD